jgi:heme/copper-type cytochrome/quinol oxidase subunit 3
MENIISEKLLARSNGTANHAGFRNGAAANVELAINKSFFGLLIFLGTEAMFFAGLISAFLILKAGSGVWPPMDQPRLPVEITALNTLVLLASAYTMHRAVRGIRAGQQKPLINWLATTGALGTIFLGVQGTEWIRLVNYGLTFTSSNYGATFYTLIGAHGLHVFAAVIVLAVVFLRALQQKYSALHHNGLELCRLYWFFVVGIWPVLYGLVYLS